MTLTNKAYDRLKFVALVLLPALAAAYFGLSQVWHLPKAEEIVGTATIIDTFLGLILRSSNTNYNRSGAGTDGDLVVQEDGGEKYLGLAVNRTDLDAIPGKRTVTLRVLDQRGQDSA